MKKKSLWDLANNKKFHFALLGLVSLGLLLFTMHYFSDFNREVKDNYCRVNFAKKWWDFGFWEFPGTVWLPLHFVLIVLTKGISGIPFAKSGEYLSVFFGALTIPLLYLYSSFLVERRLALVVAFIALTCWPFLEFSSMAMAEPLFLFCVFLALILVRRSNFLGFGMALGCASLLRVEGWALMLVTTALVVFSLVRGTTKKKQALSVCLPLWSLFLLNTVFFKGELLRPFKGHLQAHASDQEVFVIEKGLKNFSWAALEFSWPLLIFVVCGYLLYFLRERKASLEFSLFLGAFVIGALKWVGVVSGEILSDPRYFLLFVFMGIPIATYQFRKIKSLSVLLPMLLVLAFSPAWYSLQQSQRQDRPRLAPAMTEALAMTEIFVKTPQKLGIAVSNYDNCWFAIQSSLPSQSLVKWPNERQRIRKQMDLKKEGELFELYHQKPVQFVLVEKNTIYAELIREKQKADASEKSPLHFQLLKEVEPYALYSVKTL